MRDRVVSEPTLRPALAAALLALACGGGQSAATRSGDSAGAAAPPVTNVAPAARAPASTTPAGGGYAQEGTPGAGVGTGNTMLPDSTARQDSALTRNGQGSTQSGQPRNPQPE